MKKLLLGTAAIALGLGFAMPAKAADGVKLGVSGHFKGYAVFVSQDDKTNADAADATNESARNFDILRETELHFSGETTLDNGMTVGAHMETDVDGREGVNGAGTDAFQTEESYVYFSGTWGRVNFGKEDGAQYLMQVAAPAADSNIDGIRSYITPTNFYMMSGGKLATNTNYHLDYEADLSTKNNKFTYMTPMFNGFQLGASYTPNVSETTSRGADGVSTDDNDNALGQVYELAGRWEGNVGDVGVNFGAGWARANLQDKATAAASKLTDDRTQWNVGLDTNWGPFGLGAAYKKDDHGNAYITSGTTAKADDERTFVVGVDYTTGPFKLGASYNDTNNWMGYNNLDATRWSGGVQYTYGPGMTFRGSIHHVSLDNMKDATGLASTGTDNDGKSTSVVLGTQINF